MATLEDPRRYEAEDEDFLDREETYVMQKSSNKFVSGVTAKNRQQKGPKNGSSAHPTPPEPAHPKKASKFGMVAQAVKKLEAGATLTPPPPPALQQEAHAKKDKHGKKKKKGKKSHLTSISEDTSDDVSLNMNDIFPQAFDKNGASKADLNVSKHMNGSKREIYVPIVQQPWNEKSVMKFHESTIGATNVGTQYMKDIEFDDDDHSLDIGEIFPVLTGDEGGAPSKPTSTIRPPPAPQSMAARVAAVKRAEAARTNGKTQSTVAVAAAPQKPPDSKERSYPRPTPVHPNEGPNASEDTALKQPDNGAKRASLERKKSKKVKKSSRKKSRRHLHEDYEDSSEDSEARQQRRRRKKEKKAAKKLARETTEGGHEEKSKKKKHKKHKKHSRSDSQILKDEGAPNVRDNKSMPEMQAKVDIVLNNSLRERASKTPTDSTTKSVPESRQDLPLGLDDYIRAREASRRQSAISLQSDGHTTVKKSNVARKEDNSSGKAKEPLSDSARSRQHRAARKSTETALSDSARARNKARTERNTEMSDSEKFRNTLLASRRAAADAKNAPIKPLSPRKEYPDKNTGSNKNLRSSSPVKPDPNMDNVGRFDMLAAVDAAVNTKKAEKRTSGTKPLEHDSVADIKKKKNRNIFKSIRIFSRRAESDSDGAEQSRRKRGLFGRSKTKAKRAQSVPKPRALDWKAHDELTEYLHNSKTDSKTSWNDSIEENKLLHSPAKPTLDLSDFNRVLGTPPAEKLGTAPLFERDYSDTRRGRTSPQGERC